MNGTFAILWSLRGHLHTGRLEVLNGRLELRARGRTLSIPLASIVHSSVDRGPSVRIRGLPILRLELSSGLVVKIASLESVTVLKDIAGMLSVPVPA